ncbi:response regulator [Methanosarcina sp. KYL-1]|uniref:response regulator n=1 Tax=Methanosarcina sp. KYL-1 TaxID=2602068 RepID=UPI0026EE634A|nr:response regulator [Methanosarcina sp. KYL-1]MCQ1535841.1 response regulator [Methanosarcina sp. KYL-1]
MYENNLDRDILRLIEEQPELSDRAIANALSVSEEQVKARISCFQDTREKILIVNAEMGAMTALKMELEAEDYNVVGASDGFSAVNLVKAEKPDIVLLDRTLPGMDGFEVCRQLKADSLYGHVPVVMLSAGGAVEDVVKGFETGADDYVMKPFNLQELKARIRMVLRRSRF